MQTLAENVKEVEAKKRKLEEAVDTLNERLANQTAKGAYLLCDLFCRETRIPKI